MTAAQPEATVVAEDPMKIWAVVQTHAGKETFAKFHLERQGFEVYLPMRLTKGRTGQGGVRPFFPRYLFVTVTAQVRRWQSIFSTLGVHSVFTCRERLIGVRDGFIEGIRAQEADGLLRAGVGVQIACPFQPGDKALWNGIEVIFAERVDERRATVLLTLLGRRDSPATVDLTKLEASEPPTPVRFTAQHRRSS